MRRGDAGAHRLSTLFLGLVSGRVTVELAVTGPVPVVAIDLALDGVPTERFAGPPFRGQIDLGKNLLPHHLVARAVDAKGAEIASAEQWINLPQPPAVVILTPETDPAGRLAAVGVSFQIETYEKPSAVLATLDGAPLAVREGRVALPAFHKDLPHLLTVEGHFASGLSARRDLAFGGGLEGEVTTDLTAVLVRTAGSLPEVPALAGGFTAQEPRGAVRPPLTVSATEDGPGEIFALVDPDARQALAKRENEGVHFFGGAAGHQAELPIRESDRLRLVDTTARAFSGDGEMSAVFGISPELQGRGRDLYPWLAHGPEVPTGSRLQLADALAVAGVQALADQRRRVALVVLSGHPNDASRYDPATVRRYLEAIRVPLYVWSLAPPPYPPAVARWGKVEDVSNLRLLRLAYQRLDQDLAAQRIVWVQGRHLPQSIALSPQAPKGIELVAGAER
jgi:hypothetical protein